MSNFHLGFAHSLLNESWVAYDLWFSVNSTYTEIKLPTSTGSSKKQESSRKTSISALLTMPKPLTVWITKKLWKILKETEISDHLTCLLRNLYTGQEATVRTGHGTADWYQIGKGVRQGSTFSSVQWLSGVRLFATPWITAPQASLSITNSRSSPRLTSIELVMPSSHLILCHPLLLLPTIPPSIRVFSNESTLHMRWPKYWSFSFSIIPSKEHPGLISFRMD